LLLHLIAQDRAGDFGEALHRALTKLEGAYSFAILHDQEMWAVKDPRGIRPLCLGRLGDAWIVASETCALDVVGATFLRELAPGEIVRFSGGEVTRPPASARCPTGLLRIRADLLFAPGQPCREQEHLQLSHSTRRGIGP
jgi:amidophosphoribosyltransferase